MDITTAAAVVAEMSAPAVVAKIVTNMDLAGLATLLDGVPADKASILCDMTVNLCARTMVHASIHLLNLVRLTRRSSQRGSILRTIGTRSK